VSPVNSRPLFLLVLICFSSTVGPSAHQLSRPTITFGAHGARDFPPNSSSNSLEIPEGVPSLMDESVPHSPVGLATHSGLLIPPFQDTISRVRTQREAPAIQEDLEPPPTGDLGTVSAGQSGRLETSMSLGRIVDFLGDICACFDLFTPLCIFHSLPCSGALPVREFSNRVRFMGNRGVNRCTPATTSSTTATHIPEESNCP
jgi:hypothetical protein